MSAQELVHVSLFTGFAMKDQAARAAGFTMKFACEIEPYAQQVIMKHFPNVPIWRDVRDLSVDAVRSAGIRRVDLLTGGYPCQPFSLVGQRQGTNDPRHLWPHMRDLIVDLRPTWVVAENVEGHVSLGLDDVLDDLESADYEAWTFVFPARAIGAAHRRNRTVIVANSKGERREGAGSSDPGAQRETTSTVGRRLANGSETAVHESGWAVEPGLGRTAHGSADWVLTNPAPAGRGQNQFEWEPPQLTMEKTGRIYRIRGLGNGVHPRHLYPVFKMIAEQLRA